MGAIDETAIVEAETEKELREKFDRVVDQARFEEALPPSLEMVLRL